MSVYLDSADFSTLSDPRRAGPELIALRDTLLDLAERRGVEFVYSATHLCEMAPTVDYARALASARTELLIGLCGHNTLISFDRLIALEISRLAEPSLPPLAPRDVRGEWYPAMDGVVGPLRVADEIRDHLRRHAAEQGLNHGQRRALNKSLFRNGAPRAELRALLRSLANTADLSEMLEQYPMPPQHMRTIWRYVAGEVPAAVAERAFLDGLTDPRFMLQWFERNVELNGTFVQLVRAPAQEMLQALRTVAADVQPIMTLAQATTGAQQSASARIRKWPDESLLHIANSLMAKHQPTAPPCAEARQVAERCPGLATMVRVVHQALKAALTSAPRRLLDSDFVDALHAMYAPYVRVFRADRFMAPHVRTACSSSGTIVASALGDVASAIELALGDTANRGLLGKADF